MSMAASPATMPEMRTERHRHAAWSPTNASARSFQAKAWNGCLRRSCALLGGRQSNAQDGYGRTDEDCLSALRQSMTGCTRYDRIWLAIFTAQRDVTGEPGRHGFVRTGEQSSLLSDTSLK